MIFIDPEIWVFSSFLFNVLCSIIASTVFIFILLIFLKPSIDIVPLISKGDSPFDSTNEIVYGFKIINKSLFSLYDINIKATYFELEQSDNNHVDIIMKDCIHFNRPNLIFLEKFIPYYKNYDKNCFQIFTYDNIEDKLSDRKTSLKFQVYARHGLSGLSKFVTHNFCNTTEIKEGKFLSGNKKDIK